MRLGHSLFVFKLVEVTIDMYNLFWLWKLVEGHVVLTGELLLHELKLLVLDLDSIGL